MNLPDLSSSLIGAQSLLGWELVYTSESGEVGGIIVETEAYGPIDPASHAHGGKRIRNAPLFEPAGTVYIYFTYGMHYCLNIVTGPEGSGQGVLIRALEPTRGVAIMQNNRNGKPDSQLTNGPAKLVEALGVKPILNGKSINRSTLHLVPGKKPDHIVQTTRIGISQAKDLPWRFYDPSSSFVSKL